MANIQRQCGERHEDEHHQERKPWQHLPALVAQTAPG
jgi:hypothetical protein